MTATMDRLALNTVDSVDLSLEIAGIGSRTFAFVIDWHLRLLAALLWVLASFALRPADLPSEAARMGFMLLPAALVYFLYHPLLEVLMRGRTPGKRYAGLRIVTLEGHAPGVGALALRNLFRVLDCIPGLYAVGLIAMTSTRQRMRIGDLAAGTVVVFDGRRESTAVAAVADAGRLPARSALLVRELLERWKGLQPELRRQFALQLLAATVDEATHRLAATEPDEGLRARLEGLLAHG